MPLDKRKLQILEAIIDDYINTAEPVGSRTIAKKYGLGISSATIRNEMSDLEELGFLQQPHTSAGRVPSDKAYRLYVDRLMKASPIGKLEAENYKTIYTQKVNKIEQVILYTAKILSDITQYTSMVLTPQLDTVTIKYIQLVPVDTNYALLVIVTSSGIIKDMIITIPDDISESSINRICNILNAHFKGKTFAEVDFDTLQAIKNEFVENRNFFYSLVDALSTNISQREKRQVFFEGMSNIFNFPEYQDVVRAKNFLSLLEEKELLYKVLSNLNDNEDKVSVVIGTENPFEEIKDCSIVSASYRVGNRVLGTIGIIGPTRMKYSKVISVMDTMAKALSDYLTELYSK